MRKNLVKVRWQVILPLASVAFLVVGAQVARIGLSPAGDQGRTLSHRGDRPESLGAPSLPPVRPAEHDSGILLEGASSRSIRIPRNQPGAFPEQEGKAMVLASGEILRQQGNGFTYNSSSYGATIEGGTLDIATMEVLENKTRPRWGYRFDEMRVGSTVIVRGGVKNPARIPGELGLTYHRGCVEERYVLGKDSLEQSFIIESLPALDGDLTVSGLVSGNLTPPADGSQGSRLAFGIEGRDVVSVSEAVAVDARGERLALPLGYSQGRLSMTVRRDWLSSAAFPILIDPMIGTLVTVRTGPKFFDSEHQADVAYNSNDNLWFVVWAETAGGSNPTTAIMGQFLYPTGALCGAPIPITSNTYNDRNVALSYAPAPVNRFLVTWSRWFSTDYSTTLIKACILSGTGSVMASEFTLDDRPGYDETPRPAFDGQNWFVVWTNESVIGQATFSTVGRFVSTSGVPGTRVDPDTTLAYASVSPSIAFSNGVYILAWTRSSPTSYVGTAYARTMTPAGVLTPIQTISPNAKFVNVSAGNGKAMICWARQPESPAQSWATIVDTSLNVLTPAFQVNTTFDYCRGAYSTVDSLWYVVDNGSQNISLFGRTLSTAGVLGTTESFPVGANYQEPEPVIVCSPYAEEAMVVYEMLLSAGVPGIVAQRVGFGASLGTPSNLIATAQPSAVGLAWNPATGATSFNIKRSVGSPSSFSTLATGILGTTFKDSNVSLGTTYYYEVTAVGAAGESGPSNIASGTALSPIPPPTNLTATAGDARVSLMWTASAQATSYTVKRGTVTGGPYTSILTGVTTTSAVDTTAQNGTRYYYVVTAVNVTGESLPSNEANAMPVLPPPPLAPTNLVGTGGNQQVTLTWSASAGATSYKVFRSLTSGSYSPTPTATVSSPGFSDSGLTNGTPYYYVVVASNSGGDSPHSLEVSATPEPPPPPAPTGLTATAMNGRVSLAWSATVGALSYRVSRATTSGGPYGELGTATGTTYIDSQEIQDGTTYYYVVTGKNAKGEGPQSAQASATPQPNSVLALLVVGNTTLNTGDTAVSSRLAQLGYTVTIKKDSASVSGDATGKAIVVISSTVTSGNVNTKFTKVTVPVLNWEPSLMNPLGMTGGTSGTNFGTITAQTQISMISANSANSMAAGLTGVVTVLSSANTFTFGQPNANAIAIATLTSDSSKAVIWGYDVGAAMPGLTAPARRVGFFLNDTTAANLNPSGWSLFDAAVSWVAGMPPGPSSFSVNVAATGLYLTWAPSQGAWSYTVLRGPSANGPFTVIASGVTSTNYTDTTANPGSSYVYALQSVSDGGQGVTIYNQWTNITIPPDGSRMAVAITGKPQIKLLMQGQTMPDAWNTGTYTALVYIIDKDGTKTQLTGTSIPDNSFTLGAGSQNVNIVSTSPEQIVLTAKDDVTHPTETVTLTYTAKRIHYANYVASETIRITPRPRLGLIFRFPEDNPGRTLRTPSGGSPGDLFSTDMTTRINARSSVVNALTASLTTVLQNYPALIYPMNTDYGTGLQVGGTIGGRFISGTSQTESLATVEDSFAFGSTMAGSVVNATDGHHWINVFLMNQSAVTTPTSVILTGGVTAQDLNGIGGTYLVLSDSADSVVLAHELGHIMGLSDVTSWDFDITGTLNNLKPIYGNPTPQTDPTNPLNWNLMRQLGSGRRTDANGQWLNASQCLRAYLDVQNNPCYYYSD